MDKMENISVNTHVVMADFRDLFRSTTLLNKMARRCGNNIFLPDDRNDRTHVFLRGSAKAN